jgi:syntaxin 7
MELQVQLQDSEVQFNSLLIESRDTELQEIQESMLQVNEIFRDLGTLVNEQSYLLDNIESHVDSVAVSVENANGELRSAAKYQASRNSWKCWIFLFLLVIVLILALVIYFK